MAIKKEDRARQFMPFAALTGFYEVIRETESKAQDKKELSEEEAEILSDKLIRIKKGTVITVTYYKKNSYDIVTGMVADIDYIYRIITLVKTKIHFDDIIDIKE